MSVKLASPFPDGFYAGFGIGFDRRARKPPSRTDGEKDTDDGDRRPERIESHLRPRHFDYGVRSESEGGREVEHVIRSAARFEAVSRDEGVGAYQHDGRSPADDFP